METRELVAMYEARAEFEAAELMAEFTVDSKLVAPTYPLAAFQRQILSRLEAIEGLLRHRSHRMRAV